ncbi:MFS transporter [Campylobacter hepaticus]|uniref:MFS transporter n=1 Tax=Campylobacter hepaticus TaxID=1813019 RepID=A0A7J9V4A0_9BACT|nr:MFS transporter [Campylobacter hepaticus]AXP08192.1 MFS transporter [Campylobacter hepaticus]MPV62668.1 MFS transporter [Campylobacter hepaticus]MPV95949.1 MFS transporter [Campylobacter hepaticus]RQD88884.1 MFS transporter [Campylobacter hepaticus]RQD92138.1 MFS transporter [Campylobacter hepaticus]
MNYIDLLKNNTNIRILASVQFIVYFGAWFSQTGVFTLLVQLNAPTWATATSAMLAFLPGVLLAPINGVIVEKNKPKKLLLSMISIELISIFCLIFVTSLDMLWLLFILIFIRLCIASIYFQAEMSLMAKILNPKELKLVNEMHSIIWAISYTAGMASAGIFIYFLGVKIAFLFDCTLILIGIYCLSKLNIFNFKQKTQHHFFIMIKEGLFYVLKNKIILHLILLHAFIGLTAYETLVTLLAQHSYKEVLSAALIIGFLNAIRACSLAIGPIILSKFINNNNLFYMYLGQGLGIILWAITQFNFYISFIGLIGAGFFTSTLWAYTYTMIQKNADKQYHGRVIAYTDMVYLSFSASISLLMGFLFELGLNLQFITFLLGMIFVLAAFYWKWFYHKYL